VQSVLSEELIVFFTQLFYSVIVFLNHAMKAKIGRIANLTILKKLIGGMCCPLSALIEVNYMGAFSS